MPRLYLETPRLIVREMVMSDIAPLYAMFNETAVMRYYEKCKTEQETCEWIAWNQKQYAEYGHGLWILERKEDGAFIGQAGIVVQEVEGRKEKEIGYMLSQRYWKQGFAGEAALACKRYGREVLNAHRLISLIDPGNQPSIAVAERMNMTREKIIHKWNKEIALYAVNLIE